MKRAQSVAVVLSTNKRRYAPGETIAADLSASSASGAVTLLFTSGQRYDFVLTDGAGTEVWRWSAGRGFVQMLGEETLAPGRPLLFRERFAAPLAPGQYRLVGLVTATVGPPPAVLLIAVTR